MSKRNKIRYKAKPVIRQLIKLTGNVYLQQRDDDQIAAAVRGDFAVYPKCDALETTRVGDYGGTGMSGYFKVDVNDGKQWCAVLIQDIFPGRQHHFSKTECPIDTYELCAEMLKAMQGKNLQRTYREHYEPEETEA
jgi:hypothetical protein